MLTAPVLHAHCPFSQKKLVEFFFSQIQYKLKAFQLASATFQTFGIEMGSSVKAQLSVV